LWMALVRSSGRVSSCDKVYMATKAKVFAV
jgi:hypothetical protein